MRLIWWVLLKFHYFSSEHAFTWIQDGYKVYRVDENALVTFMHQTLEVQHYEVCYEEPIIFNKLICCSTLRISSYTCSNWNILKNLLSFLDIIGFEFISKAPKKCIFKHAKERLLNIKIWASCSASRCACFRLILEESFF